MDRLIDLVVVAQEGLGGATAPAAPTGDGGAPPGGGGAPGGTGLESILFLVLMFVVFYFLLIRPQQKQRKKHQALVAGLKRGDDVITTSGIFGTIEKIEDNTVTLEIAKGTRIKVLKTYVGGLATSDTEKELAQTPPPA